MTIASLIVDVLANTAKIEKDVAKVNSTLDSISSTAKAVGKVLAAAFTINAIKNLAMDVIDFAGHLTDLAAKTGLSTTGLQKLDLVFEQSGISMDSAAGAALKLQKLLGGDDKGLVTLAGKLGIPFQQLKAMKPEDAFFTIADAIGRIPDQNEKALASTLAFGKGGVELLAGLNGHLKETADSFEAMGLIIDEDTVAAADNFGDQLGLMGKQLLAIAATLLGPLLPALSALGAALMWIGTNVIGPVLNVAIKSAMTVLASFWSKLAEIIGNLLELGSKIPGVGKDLGAAAEWLKKSAAGADAYVGSLWVGTEKLGTTAATATPKLLGLGAELKKQTKTAEQLATEHEKLIASVRKLETSEWGLNEQIGKVDMTEVNHLKTLVATREALDRVESSTRIANFGFRGMTDELENVGEKTKPVIADLEKIYGDQQFVGPILPIEIPVSLGDGLKTLAMTLPDVLHQAFTGGGGIGGAFAAIAVDTGKLFASHFVSSINASLSAGGSGLTGTGYALAGAAGAAAGVGTLAAGGSTGQAIGAVSTAALATSTAAVVAAHGAVTAAAIGAGAATMGIGLAAIGTYMLIKHFLNDTEKKINPVRQGFIDTAGGLGMLNDRAHTAGVTLDALLDAKNPEQYKAAIDNLNAAFKFQDDAMATLQATTEKYGFTIEELGPAMRRQQLDEQAQQLFMDFQVLTAGGINVDTVINRMSDSINDFVHASLATGTEVPEAMRPMLQRMVDMGKLTDQNGTAITDLEGSGISFAMTMSEGFQKLIDGVSKLTDAITRGLGDAIGKIPQPHIQGTVGWTVDPLPDVAATRLGRTPGRSSMPGASSLRVMAPGPAPAAGADALQREVQGLRRDLLLILPMHIKAAVAAA